MPFVAEKPRHPNARLISQKLCNRWRIVWKNRGVPETGYIPSKVVYYVVLYTTFDLEVNVASLLEDLRTS